jgi:hypothetical protein
MPLFCDQCGEEFGENTLRADSKFCSHCGKALSDFIKQQCSHLFKSLPTSSRSPGTGESQSPGSGRKRKTAGGDGNDADGQLNDANGDGPSKQKGRPGNYSHPIDESSTDEDPESEEHENQVSCTYVFFIQLLTLPSKELRKGKRVRRSTQRYGDEITRTNTSSKRNGTGSNTSPTKKVSLFLNNLMDFLTLAE